MRREAGAVFITGECVMQKHSILILYTLEEIKKLLAQRHKTDIKKVSIFQNGVLSIVDGCTGHQEDITDDHYIFEIYKEKK